MSWQERIGSDPAVCGGRPVIKGTRLTVEFVLGLKAAGWSESAVLENYPQLNEDDLRAVYSFAQAMIEEEKYGPLPNVA
ncbi:DUF433 domain-containing protein [Myxococcota bacterium]|nr:DUF433 domain-containing protein [Myxococcota bacterium]